VQVKLKQDHAVEINSFVKQLLAIGLIQQRGYRYLEKVIVRKLLQAIEKVKRAADNRLKKLAEANDNFDVSLAALVVQLVQLCVAVGHVFKLCVVIEVVRVVEDARILMILLHPRKREIVRDVLAETLYFCDNGAPSRHNRQDVPPARVRAREQVQRGRLICSSGETGRGCDSGGGGGCSRAGMSSQIDSVKLKYVSSTIESSQKVKILPAFLA
jgi:hypothetical protein